MKLRTTQRYKAAAKDTVCHVFLSPLREGTGFVATLVYYKRPDLREAPGAAAIKFQHQNFFNSSASAVLADCKSWIKEHLGESMELLKQSGT